MALYKFACMSIRPVILLFAVAAAFVSCTNNVDQDGPVTMIEVPMDTDTIISSEGIRLVASLEDEELITQYRVELTGVDSLNGLAADTATNWINVYEASQGQFYIDETFDLPEEQFNGHYTLSLHALDAAGNQSDGDTVSFYIRNPLDLQEISFADTMVFDTIEEFRGGVGINIDILDDKLTYAEMWVSSVDGQTEIAYREWLDVNYFWININTWFTWDNAWVEGEYTTRIVAWDQYGYKEYTNSFYIKK